jgi:prefoldin subunit 5
VIVFICVCVDVAEDVSCLWNRDGALQYMHSLNIDIEKMEEEIQKLDVEATNVVEENKGKNDNWQQVCCPESRGHVSRRHYLFGPKHSTFGGCVFLLPLLGACARCTCVRGADCVVAVQIKISTMERVDKLTKQDEQLVESIEKTQEIISKLVLRARSICRYPTSVRLWINLIASGRACACAACLSCVYRVWACNAST